MPSAIAIGKCQKRDIDAGKWDGRTSDVPEAFTAALSGLTPDVMVYLALGIVFAVGRPTDLHAVLTGGGSVGGRWLVGRGPENDGLSSFLCDLDCAALCRQGDAVEERGYHLTVFCRSSAGDVRAGAARIQPAVKVHRRHRIEFQCGGLPLRQPPASRGPERP
jgi:hypothetical protein